MDDLARQELEEYADKLRAHKARVRRMELIEKFALALAPAMYEDYTRGGPGADDIIPRATDLADRIIEMENDRDTD